MRNTVVSIEEQSFAQNITPHDRHQFELKLDYKFDKELNQQNYLIEMYFFLPLSFDIKEKTYSSDDFYRDLKKYIRFKTPVMTFEDLVNEKLDISPLFRLRDVLNKDINLSEKESIFIYESKMLGCIFRSLLRDTTAQIVSKLEKNLKNKKIEKIQDLIQNFESKCITVIEKYRNLKKMIDEQQKISSMHKITDEFLSLTLLKYYYQLVQTCESRKSSYQNLFDSVKKSILDTQEYCNQNKFMNVSEKEEEKRELYLYRYNLMKKYMSNILYLDIDQKNPSSKWLQFSATFSAGIAMLFATIIGFFAQKYFPNYSSGLLFALVIIYMGKDRIKEFCKDMLKKYVADKFYDIQTEIKNPDDGKSFGNCYENFSYVKYHDLPKDVKDKRSCSTFSEFAFEERRESIIHYKRYIKLSSDSLFKLKHRVAGANDIIRFNISQILTKIDEAEQKLPVISKDNNELEWQIFPRVYHLDVVFLFANCDNKENDKKIMESETLTVILDQNGIKRVDKVKSKK